MRAALTRPAAASKRCTTSDAVGPVAKDVAAGLTPGGRTLVLGTEEFMYTPLRIAEAVAGLSDGEVVYHSTTRSPVHVVDVDGYAVRSRLSFPAPGPQGYRSCSGSLPTTTARVASRTFTGMTAIGDIFRPTRSAR